VINRV